MKIALAIFVKTPGLSKIKTRLEAGFGKSNTETFYEYAVKATADYVMSIKKDLVKDQIELTPYWAVAEEQGMQDSRWNSFQKISQGHGELGQRLHHISQGLNPLHDVIIFMGVDSPHVDVGLIGSMIRDFILSEQNFLIAPARDGGFYLYGSKVDLAASVWNSIEYSTKGTAQQLIEKIKSLGEGVSIGPSGFDIDLLQDLESYKDINNKNLLPIQNELINWVNQNLPGQK